MIFLSASIPNKDRDKKYYLSADVIAIRDSVRALATVVIPNSKLVWGGHPAITPLIRYVLDNMKKEVNNHVTLYQSKFFESIFPKENKVFENLIITNSGKDKESSLLMMRTAMFKENNFKVGIFIGGMEGVEQEFELFTKYHPTALVLPVASTGAAAKFIYDRFSSHHSERLLNDYAYMALFQSLLKNHL